MTKEILISQFVEKNTGKMFIEASEQEKNEYLSSNKIEVKDFLKEVNGQQFLCYAIYVNNSFKEASLTISHSGKSADFYITENNSYSNYILALKQIGIDLINN